MSENPWTNPFFQTQQLGISVKNFIELFNGKYQFQVDIVNATELYIANAKALEMMLGPKEIERIQLEADRSSRIVLIITINSKYFDRTLKEMNLRRLLSEIYIWIESQLGGLIFTTDQKIREPGQPGPEAIITIQIPNGSSEN